MLILKKKDGQMLIEVLIGLALVTLSISFGIILVFGSQNILIDRTNTLEARSLAREGLEAGTLLLKNNWSVTADGDHGIVFGGGAWQFTSTTDQSSIYTRTLNIRTIDGYQKEIKSTVQWTTPDNRSLNYELITLVTNWIGSNATGGDTGGGGLSGDWTNPYTLGSIDLGPGNSATDLDVKDKIVYISAEASAESKPDFFIIDATNGAAPLIISSLDTGESLNALDVAGNYAYVANDNDNEELQIIDVTNINSPSLITTYAAPEVSGASYGKSIFYFDSRIYLGLNRITGPEFHIIDVSNPFSPSSLGSYEVNGDVNSIHVEDGIAYIANSTDNEVLIIDVTNPTAISLLGSYNGSGSEDANIGYKFSSSLYLGRKSGGSHEFSIVSVSTSTSPALLGSVEMSADVNDIRMRDYLSFIGTSESNSEFQVWNVSNPASPTLVSSFNFPQVAMGIDYEDNLVYVAVRSNDALRIITSRP